MKMCFDFIAFGFNYEFDEGGIIVQMLKIVLKSAKSAICLKKANLCMQYRVYTRKEYMSQFWASSNENKGRCINKSGQCLHALRATESVRLSQTFNVFKSNP